MAQIPFTVSARTARLIGRENVAHAEGAIIELVKNCYDADADFSFVLVNPAKKCLIIFDNGHGMTKDDITKYWMTIGTDNKEKHFTSSKGRVKSGAKGIGRFALDRLGQKCTMYTLPKGKNDGFKWEANWNDFEKTGVSIDKVFADLNQVNNLNLISQLKSETGFTNIFPKLSKYSIKQGTLIKIEFPRDNWDEDFSNKIYRSLEILTPPAGQNKFDVYFFNEKNKSLYGKIENEAFNDYDYKLVATYKKNKERELKVSFHRNEFDVNLVDNDFFKKSAMTFFPYDKKTFKKEKFVLDKSFYDLIPGYREKEKNNLTDTIGDFEFTFYFFKTVSASEEDAKKYKHKTFTSGTRKKWAEKFGGIKLFRDNFRVRPYGEVDTASSDWLLLGDRQASSPAAVSRKGDYRVRPYQVAGTVRFSRISKLFLEDKSGREGLIENDTFVLFKNILTGIIRLQEDDRSTIAENLKEYFEEVDQDERDEKEAENLAYETDDLDQTQEETKAQNRKLKKGVKSQKKKIDQKDEELVMSRAMASAGILIASFSHEFNNIKNKLNNRTTNLKNSLLPLIPEAKLKTIENRKNPYHLINEIKKIDEKIKQWIEFSISLTRKDRRKSKKIDLIEYFNEFKKNWKRKLDERGIALNINYSASTKGLFVKMIELDVDTIFDNLLTNSIEAFQRDGFKSSRIINITLTKDDNLVEIEYKDSGPGLSRDIKKPEEIFNAFVTTKVDSKGNEIGTGLGMWLLKSSVDYNKGNVRLYNPEKGFQIKIKLNSVK